MKAWILAVMFAFPLSAHAQVLGGSASMGGAAILSAAGSAVGTVTYIQGCNIQNGSAATSLTCALPNPVAAGDLVYLMTSNANTNAVTYSFTGDSGAVVTDLPQYAWNGNTQNSYYILAAGGGETAINVAITGTVYYPALQVAEFHCVPSCSLDASDSGTTGSGTAMLSNSITPTQNGDLIIGLTAGGCCATTITAGSGYTLAAATYIATAGVEYLVQTTAAPITAIATQSAGGPWMMHVLAFKP